MARLDPSTEDTLKAVLYGTTQTLDSRISQERVPQFAAVRSEARSLHFLHAVALILFVSLVGCEGATKSVRNDEPDSIAAVPVPSASGTGLPAARNVPPFQSPLQITSGEGLGNGIPRAMFRLVPRGATTVAEVGAAAAGEAITAGGAVVAVGGSVVLVCLSVSAAVDGTRTPIDIADTFYGSHFGDIHGWFQDCYAPKATVAQVAVVHSSESRLGAEPQVPLSLSPAPEGNKNRGEKTSGRVYVSYTKFNLRTGRYYSGRTSMVIDLRKPLRPQAEQAVDMRDSNHHVDEDDEPGTPGFRQAVVDEFDVGNAIDYANRYGDTAYWRVRGREQQLMDSFGGAQSDTREPYQTENIHRGVAKNNPLGKLFHDAATKKWGQLHPYTGN